MSTPIRAACALTLLTTATLAHGAGFALSEQSASQLGYAFAGAAAHGEDPSVLFYNPAALAAAGDPGASLALHAIRPSARFRDDGSNVSGSDGGDAGTAAVVPNAYLSWAPRPGLQVGLGLTVPFGLATEYEAGWRGRYQALRSEVRSVDLNPVLALSLSPRWHLGLGMNVQYFQADLSNAVDFSAVCLGAEGAGRLPSGTCAAAGLDTPRDPATDGKSEISGSSWSLGYQLGLLFTPDEATRIGLAYRSPVRHTLDGEADFTLPAAAANVRPLALAFADGPAFAPVTLPETLSLAASRRLGSRWTLRADYTRTGWSRYERLQVEFENPNQPASEEVNDWRDSHRLGLGLGVRLDERWHLRAGLAYETTPVPSPERRSARIPDDDRRWIALGAGYRHGPWRIDLGYAHLFVDQAPIRRTGATGDLLAGRFDNAVDIFSLQLNRRW